jgi:hypothetical protein
MHRPHEPTTPDSAVDAAPAELKRREREWDSRRDPASLWPGLDAAALQPAADAIGTAAAAILRGERAALGADRQLDTRAVGVAALLSGTGPLLGYWIETGRLDVADEVATLLGEHLDHGRRRAERIRRQILPLLTRFVEEGLEPTAIKGFHTSHEYFPEPGVRPFADVDLLVHPQLLPRATALLREAGFVSDRDVPGPYRRNWTPPGNSVGSIESFERWDARSRWSLELHGGLFHSHLLDNRVQLDVDWSARHRWTQLGIPVHALSQPQLIGTLAIHASGELYSMRLMRLIEQTLVIRRDRDAGRLDWAAVEEHLTRTRTLRFAYPAFTLVERLAPGTIDAGLLSRARGATTRRLRAVTARFTPTAPILSRHDSVAEKLMWANTPWRTLHRLYEMVGPPRDQPWSRVLEVYHDRIARLFAGRLALRPAPSLPPDDPSA